MGISCFDGSKVTKEQNVDTARLSIFAPAKVANEGYVAAMCAVQHNPVIRDHYQQLTQRGKAKKLALVACLRKLLVILNAMLRDRQPWRDSSPTAIQAAD